jgi:pSer/pThr/pTyr-binding forkhead associated (FHA) protein
MIVYCEECGFKNVIDEERVSGTDPQIPCEKCGEFLRFYGLKAEALKASLKKSIKPPKKTPKKIHSAYLILKYGKVVVVVNQNRSRVEIGRQKSNDIQVSNNRVSRTHAVVEYKEGTYYLTDQSSNGTYLLMEGTKGVTVKRKQVELTAKGVIGPGYKVDFKSSDAIQIIFEPTS